VTKKKSLGSFQICSYCLSVAGEREQGLGGGLEVWGQGGNSGAGRASSTYGDV